MTILKKPTMATFFSGIEGAGVGFKQAGFNLLMATDKSPHAKRAFQNNLPGNHHPDLQEHLISTGDYLIADMFDEGFAKTWLEAFEEKHGFIPLRLLIDLVVGGPPCQDSSKANRQASPFGKRNELMFLYLKFVIEHLEPKVIIMEQVPWIFTEESMKPLAVRLEAFLNSYNHLYTWEIQALNAADYGANQERVRMILIMVHNALNSPVRFPEPIERSGAQFVKSIIPDVQLFTNKFDGENTLWRDASKNIMYTVTASGGEKVVRQDGKVSDLTTSELLKLCHMPLFNLSGIPKTHQHTLIGNMVMPPLAYHLGLEVKKILQATCEKLTAA